METSDTAGLQGSPLLQSLPNPQELLRRHLHPPIAVQPPGQPSLSDRPQPILSGAVLNRREHSAGAPVWPQC